MTAILRRLRATLIAAGMCLGTAAPARTAALAAQTGTARLTITGGAVAFDHQTRATAGVVKSIDSTTMTLSRRKNRGDITFKLSAAVHREGAIVVGATVAVRYRDEGDVHVATAVSVQKSPGRQQPFGQSG